MEMEEIVKILIVIIVLFILIGAVLVLFKVGGGNILDSIRNATRFGR